MVTVRGRRIGFHGTGAKSSRCKVTVTSYARPRQLGWEAPLTSYGSRQLCLRNPQEAPDTMLIVSSARLHQQLGAPLFLQPARLIQMKRQSETNPLTCATIGAMVTVRLFRIQLSASNDRFTDPVVRGEPASIRLARSSMVGRLHSNTSHCSSFHLKHMFRSLELSLLSVPP
jgi:hypothetical protein